MKDKFKPGDVLENLIDKNNYVLIVHTPSQRNKGCYLMLDLILRPSAASTLRSLFQFPDSALGEFNKNMVEEKGTYRKVDHVNWKDGELSGLLGTGITMDIPRLEQYLRVNRNY